MGFPRQLINIQRMVFWGCNFLWLNNEGYSIVLSPRFFLPFPVRMQDCNKRSMLAGVKSRGCEVQGWDPNTLNWLTCWAGVRTGVGCGLRVCSGFEDWDSLCREWFFNGFECVGFCNSLLAIQFDGPLSSAIFVNESDWPIKQGRLLDGKSQLGLLSFGIALPTSMWAWSLL